MDKDPGRILAVDPGEKRLGIAISDPTQTIASSLCVIEHQSRSKDALAIYALVICLLMMGNVPNFAG